MRFNRFRMHLLVVSLAAGCATTRGGGTSPELISARSAYAQAAAGPAVSDAPESLAIARSALDAAERVNREDPMSYRERHLAYLAKKRAEIAMTRAQSVQAMRDAQLARAQLARNADEAARAAERAKAEATRASEQAKLANQQAQLAGEQATREASARIAAEHEAIAARTDLDRLETELADTERQLAAKGTQLDEQSRELKDRMIALQAQVDRLRIERDKAQLERDKALSTIRTFASVGQDSRGLVITMPSEIMFRSSSDRLLPRAKEKLDELVVALNKLEPTQSFVIEGHTDSRGGTRYNRELSRRRAIAVRTYLVEQGVGAERIVAIGKGEEAPVASNSDPEGRANNRRVEIVVSPATVSRR